MIALIIFIRTILIISAYVGGFAAIMFLPAMVLSYLFGDPGAGIGAIVSIIMTIAAIYTAVTVHCGGCCR